MNSWECQLAEMAEDESIACWNTWLGEKRETFDRSISRVDSRCPVATLPDLGSKPREASVTQGTKGKFKDRVDNQVKFCTKEIFLLSWRILEIFLKEV